MAETLAPFPSPKEVGGTKEATGRTVLGRIHLLSWLRHFSFGILAFLTPLLIRSVPEIIAGPFPIGYDTMGSYVPLMLNWGSGNLAGFNPMIGGWLIFALFGLTYRATHIDPILIVKIAAPILYGVLGSAEYLFGRKVLAWGGKKSFLLVAIASLYFVSLRLSWDLFRNTLGVALMLFALVFEKNVITRRGALTFASLVYLVTITHLLAATLLIAFIFVEVVKTGDNRLRKIVCAVPGLFQFGLSLWGLRTIGELAFAGESQTLEGLAAIGYPVYVFLPLIPLAILGARGLRNSSAKYWIAICALGVLLGVSPLSLRVVAPFRWTIMMSIPLAIYATNGLARLSWKGLRDHPIPGQRFPKVRLRSLWVSLYVLALLILGVSYLALPVRNAFPYYRFQSPSSMLQSTVPLEDSQYLVKDLEWLASSIGPGYVLMAHHTIYGWAEMFFHAKNPLIWFYPDTSLGEALQMTLAEGYSQIYTVWWNDSSVPKGFVIVHQGGPFGVFLYAV